MTEPLTTDRVFELLVQAENERLDILETARLVAKWSEKGGPGPKPPDYMSIHVEDGVIRVATNTHYVNHGGTWVSAGPVKHVKKKLPPMKYSQFVCIDLEELGLESKE